MIKQLKEELEFITQQLDKGRQEKGLEWWVYNDKVNEWKDTKSALTQVIKYLENKE